MYCEAPSPQSRSFSASSMSSFSAIRAFETGPIRESLFAVAASLLLLHLCCYSLFNVAASLLLQASFLIAVPASGVAASLLLEPCCCCSLFNSAASLLLQPPCSGNLFAVVASLQLQPPCGCFLLAHYVCVCACTVLSVTPLIL